MRYLAPLFLGLCMLAPAQQPKEKHQHEPSAEQQSAKPDCTGMMAKMQRHRAAMKKMDEKLQAQLDAMNKASGEAKRDAMEEVVEMLAQQRIQMHERMMSMSDDRSQHMMGHMQQGEKGMKAMMGCPMMQSRSGETPAKE